MNSLILSFAIVVILSQARFFSRVSLVPFAHISNSECFHPRFFSNPGARGKRSLPGVDFLIRPFISSLT